MKAILIRIGEIRLTPIRFFGFWAILFALVFTLCSCSDDLDVQQSYPFSVDVMPYGDKITNGETIELRFEIKPEGNYTNTLYTSATSSMKATVNSNSSAARYWSTMTVLFSTTKSSGSTIPPTMQIPKNLPFTSKTIGVPVGSNPSSSTTMMMTSQWIRPLPQTPTAYEKGDYDSHCRSRHIWSD